MHKVFLVDDEIVIREGIRASSLWEGEEFTLVGEASDGELALSMLQDTKPDILITDIKMPFMDGLELCRQVKKTMPWMRMVILSGYDDFTFAKQAITLGVTDYLLKPVDMDELLPVLRRIAGEIDREKRESQNLLELKAQAASNRPLLKERVLQDLFSGTEADMPSLLEQARKARLDLSANCYLAVLLMPQYTKDRIHEYAAAERNLKQLSDGSGGTVHLCSIGGWPVALVLGDNEQDLEERGYSFAQSAQFALERNAGLSVQISLGEPVHKLSEVGASLRVAQQVARTMDSFFRGERGARRIMGAHDVGIQPRLSMADLDSVAPIGEQIKYIALQDANAAIDRYAESLGRMALQSKVMTSYMYVELLMAISRLVKDSGGQVEDVLPARAQDESVLGTLETTDDVRALFVEMLRAAIAYRDEQSSTRYGMVTRQAIAYIHAHYDNIGMSMREVATHVALSNSHFSTVFSQEVGVTFTEYLTGVRMEQAKRLLLETELRSQEIATRVGYNDRHYFSYLFKRVVGVSPMDYRRGER